MPDYRFKPNDIYINSVRTYPKTNFVIYQSNSYLDNTSQSGSNSNVPDGHLDLYELNVNRAENFGPQGPENPVFVSSSLIQQYVHKTGEFLKFKSLTTNSFFNDSEYGDKLFGNATMTGTIEIMHFSTQSYHDELAKETVGEDSLFVRRKLFALENTINYYTNLSSHFNYSGTLAPNQRDLNKVESTLISIPSLFYGERIRKGSVKLSYYVTGTLAGVAKDDLQDGTLVHTAPASTPSAVSGSTVGLVLYNEGIILLTSSLSLHSNHVENFRPGLHSSTGQNEHPKWTCFGSTLFTGSSTPKSVWSLEFQGTNHIPTLTMLAHAERGQINHSNNPTFINYTANENLFITSSFGYAENTELSTVNFVSSSYSHHSESFEKQVYISKVAVYDDDKNLIGVAKLANPYRKEEKDSITFKLKLDL
tara:strand:+ start:620 stop:1882 length:1263 start_codon:yes stop_codon:yes gene_type:complete